MTQTPTPTPTHDRRSNIAAAVLILRIFACTALLVAGWIYGAVGLCMLVDAGLLVGLWYASAIAARPNSTPA